MASDLPLIDSEGVPVFAADDQPIGHVKEVRGQYFKVDAPMEHDFWLTSDLVTLASRHQVLLRCDSAAVDRFKQDSPPA